MTRVGWTVDILAIWNAATRAWPAGAIPGRWTSATPAPGGPVRVWRAGATSARQMGAIPGPAPAPDPGASQVRRLAGTPAAIRGGQAGMTAGPAPARVDRRAGSGRGRTAVVAPGPDRVPGASPKRGLNRVPGSGPTRGDVLTRGCRAGRGSAITRGRTRAPAPGPNSRPLQSSMTGRARGRSRREASRYPRASSRVPNPASGLHAGAGERASRTGPGRTAACPVIPTLHRAEPGLPAGWQPGGCGAVGANAGPGG